MTVSTKPKIPGKGAKTAGKVIVIIGTILTAFIVIGGGGGRGIVVGFIIFILPGLIIYGAGNRKYKKAIKAPLVAAAKAQNEEEKRQKQLQKEMKKIKVKGEGEGVTVFMIILFIISFPMVIYSVITLDMPVFFFSIFLFGIFVIWASVQHGRGYSNRDIFYLNRRGCYRTKKNMRRGYRWSNK